MTRLVRGRFSRAALGVPTVAGDRLAGVADFATTVGSGHDDDVSALAALDSPAGGRVVNGMTPKNPASV